ncbi:MAG: hypothetical protein JNL87_06120 [Burkholderiaceae bacterium]|nr:hypothetical protein [Burkholderiaceae bacterium]
MNRPLTRWLPALLLATTAGLANAVPEYLVIDHSSEALIDKAGALAVWKAQVDDDLRARLQTLYPVTKWGFVSQVAGGFTEDKSCVVTARALMVPRLPGSRLVFKPYKAATTFASQPGATREQCQALAAAKLKEAVVAIGSSLVTR